MTATITVNTAGELCVKSQAPEKCSCPLFWFQESGDLGLSLAIPTVLPYFLQCSRHLPWGAAGLTHSQGRVESPFQEHSFLWSFVGRGKNQTNNKNQGLFKPKCLRQTHCWMQQSHCWNLDTDIANSSHGCIFIPLAGKVCGGAKQGILQHTWVTRFCGHFPSF